jgi:hypothetical protein
MLDAMKNFALDPARRSAFDRFVESLENVDTQKNQLLCAS